MNVPNLNELARFYVSALCLGASIKRQAQSFLQGPQVDFHVFNAIICHFFSGFWKISNREMLLWGMVGSTQPSTIPSLL
jgi:hypothetical protein